MKYSITTKEAPEAFGPYSQATTGGRFVFVSGQLGLDPLTNRLVEGGIDAETDRAIRNVSAILDELHCNLEDIVRMTVYLSDMSDFTAMNEVYGRYFPKPAPARTCIQVAALPISGARVEIDCIACR